MSTNRLLPLLLCMLISSVRADGPADNASATSGRSRPRGSRCRTPIAPRSRPASTSWARRSTRLRESLKSKPALLRLLPDVQIYHNAVRYALAYDEFFKAREIAVAKDLLEAGPGAGRAVARGQAPWNTATGLVVRGYVSKIDGSVQPYGLVVPASYRPDTPHRFRLDVWCHGRGENLSELNFINGRQTSPGEFTPPNAFVLHPYGRYCNANKFAGEIDLFEALEDIKKHYPIDEDRLVMRGFSMGGAACWQFAVHYPSMWAAAAPGAGFSETADFLKVFQNESGPADLVREEAVAPLRLHRLRPEPVQLPDRGLQRRARPAEAGRRHDGQGPARTRASSWPTSSAPRPAISTRPRPRPRSIGGSTAIVEAGRDPVPVRRALHHLDAALQPLVLGPGRRPGAALGAGPRRGRPVRRRGLDGPEIQHEERLRLDPVDPLRATIRWTSASNPRSRSTARTSRRPGRSPTAPGPPISARSTAGGSRSPSDDDGTLRKRHGLQGPIDDAFMDSFLMVRPTGTAAEREGRQVGDRRDDARRRPLAAPVPRRGARQG